MNTSKPSTPSTGINPEETQRLLAKYNGRKPGVPLPVEKNGFDLANLGSVRSQWMDVTPEMAARWLKNNFGNRPIRWDTVKAYARDMLNGLWVPTHQGLAFNDKDALIDGQHRLHAIVMSGVTIRMMVTFGLPSKIERKEMTTMDAVDRGATRSVGDQLTIQHGFSNGSITASICATLANGESEMVLAKQVLSAQPEQSLLINDRYYGVPELLVGLLAEGQRHFLVRVKANLKRRLLEVYPDGSALVEIRSKQGQRVVREIVGKVQRNGRGAVTTVRLWTSLLDGRRHPAAELLALYARRWEQELFYKELKVDMRSTPCLQSHTPLTAIQEIAALILAYAVLVGYRIEAAAVGEVGVLRISFLKTLQVVQNLWQFLEVSADLLSPDQVRLVVRRSLRRIADMAIPKRRQRSCQRALRQPVSSWPRLRKNTSHNGPVEYTVGEIYA
jgi:hypothetical protein